MKIDELNLAEKMVALSPYRGGCFREFAESLGIHPKRSVYIGLKWAGKGYYDYGTCADNGWLTPKGQDHFMALLANKK